MSDLRHSNLFCFWRFKNFLKFKIGNKSVLNWRYVHNIFFHSGVNFTNILQAQKLLVDPKSTKKTVKLSSFFALLGSVIVKAARRTLVKLNPDLNHFYNLEFSFRHFLTIIYVLVGFIITNHAAFLSTIVIGPFLTLMVHLSVSHVWHGLARRILRIYGL